MERKIVIILFIIMLGMMQGIYAQEGEAYLMEFPSFKININGVQLDNTHNINPVLVYDGITYFPIIQEYNGALLFESKWSKEKGLTINTGGSPEEIIQDRSVNNDKDKYYNAVKPSFDIYLNGRLLDNDNSKHPILVYNGITYFPLVEKYLNEDFQLTLIWSEENGLSINSKAYYKSSKVNLGNEILEMAVREQLNKLEEPLTKADVHSIKSLSLSNKNLNKLSGIEHLSNIEELYLDNNNLENVEELKSLTKLRVLYLQRNSISDIAPLENLTSLKELSLNGNRIKSLEPLGGLINLENLYFTENNITDISVLRNLVNIKGLFMKYGNHINDYSPIVSYYRNIINKDFELSDEELEKLSNTSEKPLLSIDELILEANQREKEGLKLNGFYAISSNEQYKGFKENESIADFDSISFGWAFVDYDDEEKKSFISISDSNDDFYIPEGYEELVEYMKMKNIKTNINIYASQNYDKIFNDSDVLINEILTLLRGENSGYNNLTFDGVVIDFERLPIEYKENYVEFLQKLYKELTKHNKNLVVAISPLSSYDFGRIVEISDKVILMLHDYDIKNGNRLKVDNEIVDNPNAPLEKIKGDLINILNEIDREKYSSKMWLQINFSINQWKVSEGRVLSQVPYTPKYSALADRIQSEIKSGKKIDDIIGYSKIYESPYIRYAEEGIINSIWYEDDRSVSAKIQLAKDLGLGGISLWRIGNIPDYSSDIYLDTWNLIRKSID
ncbi:leucine-rich repeat domain-containing protein [Wukongibacter baidiensis]|uniref:leucine-rich repeat domain-containing protein n=1 Tax=Wukongibacter baidiensis TaxID=1723361 RepID=UPI003D7F6238